MATVSSIHCLYAATLVYTPGMVASHGAGPKLTMPTCHQTQGVTVINRRADGSPAPDLVPPPRVLLPAHQGAATVAVTRAAPRPARALHRLLEM